MVVYQPTRMGGLLIGPMKYNEWLQNTVNSNEPGNCQIVAIKRVYLCQTNDRALI